MGTTRLRLPRALAVTVALMALACGAHAVGGGTLPPVPVMAVLSSVCLVAVMLLAGRRLTFTVLGSLLIAGQAVLHLAFTRLSLPGTALPTTFLSGHAGHTGHAGHLLAPTAAGASGMVSVAPTTEMLMLHGLATAAVALLLARGEAALLALLSWLQPLLRLPSTALVPTSLAPIPVTVTPVAPARLAGRLPHRRGPPAGPAR